MICHECRKVTVEFVQIFLWGSCQPQNSCPTFTKMLAISLSINRFPKIRMLSSLEIDGAYISVEKTTLGRLYRATASRIGRGTPFPHEIILSKKNKNIYDHRRDKTDPCWQFVMFFFTFCLSVQGGSGTAQSVGYRPSMFT